MRGYSTTSEKPNICRILKYPIISEHVLKKKVHFRKAEQIARQLQVVCHDSGPAKAIRFAYGKQIR